MKWTEFREKSLVVRYYSGMNSRFIPRLTGLLILVLLSTSLSATDLNVDYLEGDLEYRQGRDTWIDVGINGRIPEGSTVRLASGGYAELTMGPKTVTLTKDGMYETADLFGSEPEKGNFRETIGSKFAALLGRGRQQNSVAAVRAAEAETDDFISWEDETTDYLIGGMELLDSGDVEGALNNFNEGAIWETGEIQRECLFRSGLCYQILGERKEARDVLTALRVEPDDTFLAEYTVVVGTLYLESMEYTEADRITAAYLQVDPRGGAAQAAWLLSAYSLQEQGLDSESRESAQNAVDLGPGTDIGRAASEMAQ